MRNEVVIDYEKQKFRAKNKLLQELTVSFRGETPEGFESIRCFAVAGPRKVMTY